MKALLIVALLAFSAIALKPEGFSRNAMKHYDNLQKSRLGQTFLAMVELHSLSGGILQDLVGAIEEMIQEMNDELNELEFQFGVRTNEHNALVVTLEQNIQDAVIDINRSQDAIDNLLKPRRTQLKQKIENLKENQVQNRKTLAEANLVRQQQHEEFEALVTEYNQATAAVDEALALIATLTNPSLAQIKKFHHALRKVEARIRPHTAQATLIKALISLASEQNFSDQGIIGQIVEKLNEFRAAVVDALNACTAQEAENQAEHEARVEQLGLEYAEFQRGINRVTIDLTAVSDKIDEMTAFVSQRDSDRKTYQAQLDLENEIYAQETEIFNDLKNKYLSDIAISEQALGMVNSIDFSKIKI